MIRAERIWRVQRVSGLIAMFAFAFALLSVFDGLRSGIFGGQSIVQLVPGEKYAVSGPMPPKTERLEDFVITGNVPGGAISLVPEGIFTGYWFGGGMWRGQIVVATLCAAGRYEFAVHDKFGEKQNPALVFQVQVFRDQLDRQAHSPSLIMRHSGFEPYVVAACFGLLGLVGGGLNFLSGRQWTAVLSEHGCGEVFRFKRIGDHGEVGVELFNGASVPVGAMIRFSHPRRGDCCQGLVIACGKGEVTVQIAAESSVQPGDIACMLQDDAVEAS